MHASGVQNAHHRSTRAVTRTSATKNTPQTIAADIGFLPVFGFRTRTRSGGRGRRRGGLSARFWISFGMGLAPGLAARFAKPILDQLEEKIGIHGVS